MSDSHSTPTAIRLFAVCLSLLLAFIIGDASASAQQLQRQQSIVDSPHNLSAFGPGSIRASSEQEVCIFCHAAHNSSPIQPLWNRRAPVTAYTVYSSTSLQARPGQPTGSSKLCLSCHDGTIAVGSVFSRQQPIAMAGGITTLPPGHSNLGTDLSDDHPISFKYDIALSAADTKIKSPSLLPQAVRLDSNQELQCTSCHDAHNDAYGKFLVMDNTNSQLCAACHTPRDTSIAAHSDCASCHQMHTAPSGAMLLTAINANETCLKCHSANQVPKQGANIAADLNKVSRHVATVAAAPMSSESSDARTNVNCNSCHEPHTMQSSTASAPTISPKLGQVDGVSVAGGAVPTAQFQYEVCFKCHGDNPVVQPKISRQLVQANTRLQFANSAVSFHPVVAPGRNSDVPSLRVGLTTGSMIYCTDCHSSDTGKDAGGNGPNGPHGSNASPLLVAGYTTTDNTPESASAYALCYRCHDRTSILNDESFSAHKMHVQDLNTPCSVCHDSHGINSLQGTMTNNAHLINFDTTVVQPDSTGKIEYRSLAPRSGECTLSCHGTTHTAQAYPVVAAPGALPGVLPQSLKALRRTPAQNIPVRPPSVRPRTR